VGGRSINWLSRYRSHAPPGRPISWHINKVDGRLSRHFKFLRRLPPLEIRAKYEKFTADLDNTDAFFLNNSAEMPH